MPQRISGIVQLQVNGTIQDAKGSFDYNLGLPKREAVYNGAGQTIGFKEMPQTAFIEGEIIDRGSLDLKTLVIGDDLTVNLKLANGKSVVLHDAWFAGEGTASTEDANIKVRWEGKSAEEIS